MENPFPLSPARRSTLHAPTPIPMLGELIGRGDGTFILKPKLLDRELDTWITVGQAAKILGNVRPPNLYPFLGRYLVYHRPLPRRVVVSLKSALALRQATQDADFWENAELKRRITERVNSEMGKLAQGAQATE